MSVMFRAWSWLSSLFRLRQRMPPSVDRVDRVAVPRASENASSVDVEPEAQLVDEPASVGDAEPVVVSDTTEASKPLVDQRPALAGVTYRGINEDHSDPTVHWGPHNRSLRVDILDRLAEYFVVMRRLRAHDPDSYNLLSRVGLHVPNCYAGLDGWKLPSELPSFGGVFFPVARLETEGEITPALVYFQAIRRPSHVQPFNGQVYELTEFFYSTPARRRRLELACRVYVGIGRDGSPVVLREKYARRNVVRRRSKKGRKGDVVLRETAYRLPRWFDDLAADPVFIKRGDTPEKHVVMAFRMAILTQNLSAERIVIRARQPKSGIRAAFGIDLSSAPRFFRDREATALASDGRRKRIFHAVRKHQREVGGKGVVSVKPHYRGLRRFDWQGVDVQIVLPSLSSVYSEPSVTGTVFNDTAVSPGWVDSKELGSVVDRVLSQ